MKKITKILLICASLILICLFLGSCRHRHTVVTYEGVAPTCTAVGYADGEKCLTCGEIFLERYLLPPTHTGEWIYDQHPRYNVDGKRHMTCELCGEYAEERVPATGSAGFTFKQLKDGTYAIVGGEPLAYDGMVYYPEMHEGRPVTSISIFNHYKDRDIGIFIPRTVEKISFSGSGDHRIYVYIVDVENEYYSAIDGNLYNADGTTLFKYASANDSEVVTLPDGVRTIESYAFNRCDSLLELHLPEGLECIKSNAFYHCKMLFKINLPATLKIVHSDSFVNCYSLMCLIDKTPEALGKDLSLGHDPDHITDESRIRFTNIGDYLFYESENGVYLLKYDGDEEDVTLPEYENGVKYKIHNYAFSNNTSLKSIDLSDYVTYIGSHAFAYCSALESISMGNSVTEIGSFAFIECTLLKDIELCEGMTSIGSHAFDSCKALTSIKLPSTLKKLGNYAFQHCHRLKEIILNEGLEVIGAGTFLNCAVLEEIKVPDSIVSILNSAFGNCISLRTVTLPSSLTKIPDQLFTYCKSLEHISIPDGVKEIGKEAFANCLSLKSVIIPDKLESLGDYAFCGSGIESIELPQSLKTIGNGAFYGCLSLESLSIPEGVGEIPDSLLYGSGVKEVVIPRSVSSVRFSSFEGTMALTTLTYEGTVSEWKSVSISGWCHEVLKYKLTVKCTDGELEFKEQ